MTPYQVFTASDLVILYSLKKSDYLMTLEPSLRRALALSSLKIIPPKLEDLKIFSTNDMRFTFEDSQNGEKY